jgi:hypothetical protein
VENKFLGPLTAGEEKNVNLIAESFNSFWWEDFFTDGYGSVSFMYPNAFLTLNQQQ